MLYCFSYIPSSVPVGDIPCPDTPDTDDTEDYLQHFDPDC